MVACGFHKFPLGLWPSLVVMAPSLVCLKIFPGHHSLLRVQGSVVLVWLHIIRFSFSKKAIKEQKFSFSFS